MTVSRGRITVTALDGLDGIGTSLIKTPSSAVTVGLPLL